MGENWEVPFCMDNDARLAVAGEWWQGAARGKEQCSHDDNRNRYRYGSRDRWTASVWTSIFKRVLWVGILCWIIRAVGVHAGITAV